MDETKQATFDVTVRDPGLVDVRPTSGVVPTNRYLNLSSVIFAVDGGEDIGLSGFYGLVHRVGLDGRLLATLTLLDARQAASFKTGTVGTIRAMVRDAYNGAATGFEHTFGRYRVTGPVVINSEYREFILGAVQLEALDRDPKDVAGPPHVPEGIAANRVAREVVAILTRRGHIPVIAPPQPDDAEREP